MYLLLVFMCLIVFAVVPALGQEENPRKDSYNVRDFGAKGDEKTDDTAAFQKALDAAGKAGGGVVTAPRGNYRINGHLTVPEQVTLEGVARGPIAWGDGSGTTLYAYEGKGQTDGTPFIHLSGANATIKGLSIAYPEQDPMAKEPAPYPWTIRGDTDNVAVIDVFLLNPYQAINFAHAGRHHISGVQGQPLYKGIFVDYCLDVGRIENVHFWPFWTASHKGSPLGNWVHGNGTAFEIARSDWQYMLNTFCLGYKIGYRFFSSQYGPPNGNFVGIGADVCDECVVVESSQPCGLLILNGEFVGMGSPTSQGLRVSKDNQGSINMQNCTFWGPSDRIATIAGNGNATFMGCNFREWDKNGTGEAAINITGGPLTVQGCTFGTNAAGINIAEGTKSAIILGNQAEGGLKIKNGIGKAAQIALNEE